MEEDEGERHFHHYQYRDYDPSSLSNDLVHAIREDRSGTVWVGSNRGLSKFDPYKQNFRHITSWVLSDRGLNDKNVWTIEEERGGILWVGTRKGITRIDRNEEKYQHFDQNIQDRPGVNDQSVLSLHVEDGKVWAGTVDGLYRLREAEGPSRAHYERVDYIGNGGRDIERSRLYCIYPRPDGKLWLGSRNGLKLFDPETGHTRLFNEDSSSHPRLSGSVIRDIHQDKEGVYWIATDDGGLNRLRELPEKDSLAFELEHFKNDPEDPHSLSTNTLMSIWEGERGHLWIGTYGGGMNRFDPESGHVKRFTEKDGLANNVVYGVLGDGEGKLWMSTNQGLSRFDISEERFRNFDESDGLQSDEFNIGAYHRSSDGELFFGGINGLNAFYPSNITRNPHPPQVVFTGLRLFNLQDEAEKEKDPWERIRGKDRIVLEHDQNNFTIEFAALHFSRPGKNRYRYILKGFDKDPVEAGTDRTAHYTNLDPGSYSFEVHASNDDGVWTEEPARIEILVKTPFWMSWWFRGTLALSVLLIGFGAYRYRVALVEEQKRKLEREVRRRTQEVTQQKERIEEQNKELEEEKNKVDKLLVNLLPEDTANELKTGGKASARHYRMASVMFTDFKAFTKIAEKVKPTELVAKLDSYFINFDKIIERWELEKIKTIGDSYMAAGGIPIRNKTNPIHTVLAGLEIQRYMREQKERLKGKEEEAWELRIGVHTGELIAGVIGIKRFAYDIWGDTVNVASRMESNGEVGKVNISGATYSYVEPFFETSYRGKVHAKNKGHIDMYFVEGIKPELSVDGKGEEPAKPFWDFVNLHFFSKINYRKAEKSLLKKLRKELPSDLYYHDVRHTVDVCQAVERLAFMEGVEGEDLFLLKTAALFHDAGFVEQYANNEWIGARMAKEMLPKYGYTEEQLDQVASMIHATQVPPKPSNHLEEIICDADLDYLGRDDFHEIADRLKQELMERGYIQGQVEWDRMQVAFLKEHRYFTDSAIKLRRKKKEQHLREVEERLSQLEEGKDRKGEGRDPQRKG